MDKYYPALIKKIWLILLLAVLAAAATHFLYGSLTTPRYSASAGIYVSRRTIDANGMETVLYNDLLSGELAVADCKILIPGIPILGQASENLGYDYEELKKYIGVSVGGSPRVINVSYTDLDGEKAAAVVRNVLDVFFENAGEYFPNTRFELIEDVSVSLSGTKISFYTVGAGILGACAAVAVILLSVNVKARRERAFPPPSR